MKDYKQFLTETFESFFEGHEDSLRSLIGNRDSRRGHVISINDTNLFQDQEEKDGFDNNPDFLDGYKLVSFGNNKITIIQKLNLSEIAKQIELPLDEAKEEIKDLLNKTTFFFNSNIDGKDFRGYYKLNTILNENIETKGDVYLVLEILLDLEQLTGLSGLNKGRKGIKVGKGKEDVDKEEEETPSEPEEPSDEDIKSAGAELGSTEESTSFKKFRELKEGN